MSFQNHKDNTGYHTFSKQNLWSGLSQIFERFNKKLDEVLLGQQNDGEQSICRFIETKSKVKQSIKCLTQSLQTNVKNKLSKQLFYLSVNYEDYVKTKNQNQLLKAKIVDIQFQHQKQSEDLRKKIADLQTLVKIYEKALINKKFKLPQESQKRQLCDFYISKQNFQKARGKFQLIQVLDLKICHSPEELALLQKGNLASSRLSSCMTSRSRLNPDALRDMEREWNKSVNLSSKSIKSGHKLSVRREDKSFIKSGLKSKQMSRSFIKQPTSNACKINNKENKLFESSISEFSIHKY